MIGNDIIDLGVANLESNWQRPRFLSKLFSKKEQEIIASAEDTTNIVWRLWSMKESAYKAHQRGFDLASKFNPKAFECTLLSSEKGCVSVSGSIYDLHTIMKEGYIYSEATNSNFKLLVTSIFMNNSSSETLKTKIIQEYSKQLDHPLTDLSIRKCNHGIPWLMLNQKQLSLPFSITHHGKYSAFIIIEGTIVRQKSFKTALL